MARQPTWPRPASAMAARVNLSHTDELNFPGRGDRTSAVLKDEATIESFADMKLRQLLALHLLSAKYLH